VKRLRPIRFAAWLLPVALGGLVVVLVPGGFTFSTDGTSASRMAMCSQEKLRRERMPSAEQVPGEHRGPLCRHCTAPFLGTPFALLDSGPSGSTPLASMVPGPARAPVPLARARETRGPPHA